MKRIILTIISVLAFSGAYAAGFTTSGRWEYNKKWVVNNNKAVWLEPASGDGNVNVLEIVLTGDVYIRDRVLIGYPYPSKYSSDIYNGGKARLIIKNGTNGPVRICQQVFSNYETGASENGVSRAQYHNNNSMFDVWDDGELWIIGEKGKEIIIDGGSQGYEEDSRMGVNRVDQMGDTGGSAPARKLLWAVIENSGNLKMQHVIVQNAEFASVNDAGGGCSAIKLHPWEFKYTSSNGDFFYKMGQTELTNVTFQNIVSHNYGGGVINGYLKTQERSENNRESCKTTMTNVTIQNCTQYGNDGVGYAGLVRFRGDWVGDLVMKNVTMKNNTSDNTCAGLFWNAIGKPNDPALLTMDGCTFENNTVTNGGGGALVLMGKFKLQNNLTTISNNTVTSKGGGVLLVGYNSSDNIPSATNFDYDFNGNLKLTGNKAYQGGGLAVVFDSSCKLPTGSTITASINGAVFENNDAVHEGGAIYITDQTSASSNYNISLNLNSGTFTRNKASSYASGQNSGNGGAIYSYLANVSYKSGLGEDAICEFNANEAQSSGSAIYINGASNFNMKSVYAHDNICHHHDGVIYLTGSNMTMDSGIIDSNTSAGWGGGLHMKGGSTLTINKGQITNNTCNNRGAGIYMNNSTLTINNGIINDNTSNAEFGGGVCAIDNSNFTMSNGQINGNSSPNEGGGVYVKGSSFTMTNGEINGNKASSHGGGIYFNNDGNSSPKTFRFSGGTISGNTSGGFGGGVCLYTGATEGSRFELTGGNISNNTAENGGGVYLNAWGKEMSLHNTNIEHNTAYLGGGVLMYNGTLNYKKGLIRYNKAIARDRSSKPGTMYQVNHRDNSPGYDAVRTDLSGIGGGIYSTWGKINFLNTNEGFGIYSNTADFGADDLFANAENTTIDLPNPSGMNVTGFNVPNASLHWYEDYIVGDSNFDKRPSNSNPGPNERYRTLLYKHSNDLNKNQITPSEDNSSYIMAALGYSFVYCTLEKKGLKEGETTIINIYRGDKSTMGANPYVQVPLTGDKDGSAKRTILLQPGTWTVVESTWSWTYKGTATGDGVIEVNGQPAITRELDGTEDESLHTFSFTNEKQKSAPNAESIKKNDNMKTGK